MTNIVQNRQVTKMIKNMKGVVEPFTLGLVIALFGSVAVMTTHDSKTSTTVQSVEATQPIVTSAAVTNDDIDD